MAHASFTPPLLSLEPFDARNRQAFGYDMYSQVTRRTAMDRARDTGDVAISGKVTLGPGDHNRCPGRFPDLSAILW